MAEQKSKKNTEQVKTYEHIRSYMRRFYVYGFETRGELIKKMGESERTYDNERTIVDNWLAKYAIFQSNEKKDAIWYITVDASTISHNPLYDSWKAKSFTKNDIKTHFYLLDFLRKIDRVTKKDLDNGISSNYTNEFIDDKLRKDAKSVAQELEAYYKQGILVVSVKENKKYYRLVDKFDKLWELKKDKLSLSEGIHLLDVLNSKDNNDYSEVTSQDLFNKLSEENKRFFVNAKAVGEMLDKYYNMKILIRRKDKKTEEKYYRMANNPAKRFENDKKIASLLKNDHLLCALKIQNKNKGHYIEVTAEALAQKLREEDEKYSVSNDIINKKLEEYCELGILAMWPQGVKNYYRIADDFKNIETWKETINFFSEVAPLGELGSFMLDKLLYEYKAIDYDYFAFKHHFFLYTLDSGILYDLLTAMEKRKNVVMQVYDNSNEKTINVRCYPLRFYCSTQTGRRYVLCYDKADSGLRMYRLDRIKAVKKESREITADEYERYTDMADAAAPHIWGVSLMGDGKLEHLEFTVSIEANEDYILKRLQREKRSGVIKKLDKGLYQFSIDVYDARELLPWVRTFITRITAFDCSNEAVKQTFIDDLDELKAYYSEEM